MWSFFIFAFILASVSYGTVADQECATLSGHSIDFLFLFNPDSEGPYHDYTIDLLKTRVPAIAKTIFREFPGSRAAVATYGAVRGRSDCYQLRQNLTSDHRALESTLRNIPLTKAGETPELSLMGAALAATDERMGWLPSVQQPDGTYRAKVILLTTDDRSIVVEPTCVGNCISSERRNTCSMDVPAPYDVGKVLYEKEIFFLTAVSGGAAVLENWTGYAKSMYNRGAQILLSDLHAVNLINAVTEQVRQIACTTVMEYKYNIKKYDLSYQSTSRLYTTDGRQPPERIDARGTGSETLSENRGNAEGHSSTDQRERVSYIDTLSRGSANNNRLTVRDDSRRIQHQQISQETSRFVESASSNTKHHDSSWVRKQSAGGNNNAFSDEMRNGNFDEQRTSQRFSRGFESVSSNTRRTDVGSIRQNATIEATHGFNSDNRDQAQISDKVHRFKSTPPDARRDKLESTYENLHNEGGYTFAKGETNQRIQNEGVAQRTSHLSGSSFSNSGHVERSSRHQNRLVGQNTNIHNVHTDTFHQRSTDDGLQRIRDDSQSRNNQHRWISQETSRRAELLSSNPTSRESGVGDSHSVSFGQSHQGSQRQQTSNESSDLFDSAFSNARHQSGLVPTSSSDEDGSVFVNRRRHQSVDQQHTSTGSSLVQSASSNGGLLSTSEAALPRGQKTTTGSAKVSVSDEVSTHDVAVYKNVSRVRRGRRRRTKMLTNSGRYGQSSTAITTAKLNSTQGLTKSITNEGETAEKSTLKRRYHYRKSAAHETNSTVVPKKRKNRRKGKRHDPRDATDSSHVSAAGGEYSADNTTTRARTSVYVNSSFVSDNKNASLQLDRRNTRAARRSHNATFGESSTIRSTTESIVTHRPQTTLKEGLSNQSVDTVRTGSKHGSTKTSVRDTTSTAQKDSTSAVTRVGQTSTISTSSDKRSSRRRTGKAAVILEKLSIQNTTVLSHQPETPTRSVEPIAEAKQRPSSSNKSPNTDSKKASVNLKETVVPPNAAIDLHKKNDSRLDQTELTTADLSFVPSSSKTKDDLTSNARTKETFVRLSEKDGSKTEFSVVRRTTLAQEKVVSVPTATNKFTGTGTVHRRDTATKQDPLKVIHGDETQFVNKSSEFSGSQHLKADTKSTTLFDNTIHTDDLSSQFEVSRSGLNITAENVFTQATATARLSSNVSSTQQQIVSITAAPIIPLVNHDDPQIASRTFVTLPTAASPVRIANATTPGTATLRLATTSAPTKPELSSASTETKAVSSIPVTTAGNTTTVVASVHVGKPATQNVTEMSHSGKTKIKSLLFSEVEQASRLRTTVEAPTDTTSTRTPSPVHITVPSSATRPAIDVSFTSASPTQGAPTASRLTGKNASVPEFHVTTARVSESLTNVARASRSPTDAVPDSESPTKAAPVSKSPTKAVPDSESPTRAALVSESPTKAPPVSESPTKAALVSKSPTKAAPVSDSPTKASPVSDSPTKASPVSKSPTKASPVSDSPTKAPPVSDSPTKAPPVSDSPTQAPPASESPTKAAPASNSLTKAASVSDLTIKVASVSDLPTEKISATESPAGAPTVSKSVTKSVPLSESPTKATSAQNATIGTAISRAANESLTAVVTTKEQLSLQPTVKPASLIASLPAGERTSINDVDSLVQLNNQVTFSQKATVKTSSKTRTGAHATFLPTSVTVSMLPTPNFVAEVPTNSINKTSTSAATQSKENVTELTFTEKTASRVTTSNSGSPATSVIETNISEDLTNKTSLLATTTFQTTTILLTSSTSFPSVVESVSPKTSKIVATSSDVEADMLKTRLGFTTGDTGSAEIGDDVVPYVPTAPVVVEHTSGTKKIRAPTEIGDSTTTAQNGGSVTRFNTEKAPLMPPHIPGSSKNENSGALVNTTESTTFIRTTAPQGRLDFESLTRSLVPTPLTHKNLGPGLTSEDSTENTHASDKTTAAFTESPVSQDTTSRSSPTTVTHQISEATAENTSGFDSTQQSTTTTSTAGKSKKIVVGMAVGGSAAAVGAVAGVAVKLGMFSSSPPVPSLSPEDVFEIPFGEDVPERDIIAGVTFD